MGRISRFLAARRKAIDDILFHLTAFARRLTGKTIVQAAGCKWVVRTANTQKTISLMTRNNPLMESFLDHMRHDDVFLDVGANFGEYSIRAACRQPPPKTVYAIEPAPGPYLALLENIRINGCEEKCHPIAIVIGAKTGFAKLRMHSLDPSDGSSHVAAQHENLYFPTGNLWRSTPATGTNAVFSVDELVRFGAIHQPTVVKIDTEGYEGEVIRGMSQALDFVRVLAIEIHTDRVVGEVRAIDTAKSFPKGASSRSAPHIGDSRVTTCCCEVSEGRVYENGAVEVRY